MSFGAQSSKLHAIPHVKNHMTWTYRSQFPTMVHFGTRKTHFGRVDGRRVSNLTSISTYDLLAHNGGSLKLK